MTKGPSGVFAPVLTPFDATLAPEPGRFVGHCRWIVSQGAGLVPFGTTSEANSMSCEERIELLERLVSAGIDPALMMPGTGCCALTDSVRLTRHAAGLGCAGVLMLPPFYYKTVGEQGLFRNYAEIIERVGDPRLRLYLYHIPPIAQVGFGVALIERLLRAYPGVIAGIKDSSGDWSNTEAVLAATRGAPFRVFVGAEQPVGLSPWRALSPKADGCKARRAGNGHSIAKRRNAADAALGLNPKGRGCFGRMAALRVAYLE